MTLLDHPEDRGTGARSDANAVTALAAAVILSALSGALAVDVAATVAPEHRVAYLARAE
jgi:hypothetical protein